MSDVVYDVTTSWKGYIIKLDEHLERFATSCAGFKLINPYSDAIAAVSIRPNTGFHIASNRTRQSMNIARCIGDGNVRNR